MQVMTKNPRTLFSAYWQPCLWYGVLLAGFGALLWYKLGSLIGGYSVNEAAALHGSLSWRYILDHPVNAPFTAVGRLLLYVSDHGLFLMRLAAAVFGLAILSIFYWLVRHWHGERTAVIGTLLFGTSAWFLHTARLGTPDVLLFGILALTMCVVWLRRKRSALAVILSMLVAAALLYVPGMIAIVIVGVIWQWRTIDRAFKENLWAVSLGTLLALGMVAPLGFAIYQNPEIAKVIAGLPAQGWPDVMVTLRNLAEVPISIFLRGPVNPQHWLGRLPLLDFFSMAMAALGAYLYVRHAKLGRVQLVAGVLVIGSVLISLGGAVSLTLIVPFLYLLAAVGIDFMLNRWYVVFPRNVIAQAVGTGLIVLAIIGTCWYSLRHYFRAWPQASATKAVFVVPDQRISSGTIKK